MDFIDIMEDISARRITKTETGDNRIFGVMVGIVDKNYDANQPGKICVRIPSRDKNSNVLKWAKIAFMSMGERWGTYAVPEVGDEVLVTFEEGNIDKPYVIGCIAKGNAKLISSASDSKNAIKEIRARNGKSFLRYRDDGADKDQQDNLRLELFNGQVFIDLDSKNETVIISDKDKKNHIFMDGQDNSGLIRIQSQKKLDIKVADNIHVVLDGDQGKISVDCDTLDVQTNKKTVVRASGGLQLSSDSDFNVSSNRAVVKAGDSLNLEASGSASVKASTVKIG